MDRREQYLALKQESPALLEKEVAASMRIHPGTLSRLKRQWGIAGRGTAVLDDDGGSGVADGTSITDEPREVQQLVCVRREYQNALAIVSRIHSEGIELADLSELRERLLHEVSVVALAERSGRAGTLALCYSRLERALSGDSIAPEEVASLAMAIKALR